MPKDTDEVEDVYEYSEGHAQLISSGIGSVVTGYDGYNTSFAASGFIGVSANGIDAYYLDRRHPCVAGSQWHPIQGLRRPCRRRFPCGTDAAEL